MKLHRHTLKIQIVALWECSEHQEESEMGEGLKNSDLSDVELVQFLEDLSPTTREFARLKLIILNLLSLPEPERYEVIEDAQTTQRRQRQQEAEFGL